MLKVLKSFFDKRQSARVIDAGLVAQLTVHLEKLKSPVELVASLDDSIKSHELRAFLAEIAILSDKFGFARREMKAENPHFR